VTDLEPEGVAPEAVQPAPPSRFSRLLTLACSIVVAIYIVMPLARLVQTSESPLTQLERPEDSLERLVTRELDLREAMRRGLPWEWRFYRVLSGGEDPVRQSREWYEELTDSIDSASAVLHRTILQAESGDVDEAESAMVQWKARGEPGERMMGWVSAAYLGLPPTREVAHAIIAEIREDRDRDWFTDTLVARIATRVGEATTRSKAEAAIVARGRILQLRLRALMALVATLLVAGTLAVAWLLAHRARAGVADAPLPPRWSFGDGYALFVRALGAPQAIILALLFLLRRASPFDTALPIVADLPIFLWILGYLRGRETSMTDTFGLRPRRGAWPELAAVTLALIALALVGDTVVDAAGRWSGLRSHWADGFSEDMLWDSRGVFLVDIVNVTAWAPLVEELTFRGLLYATLRVRFAVWPAALMSAATFALPHGYAAMGSLSVFVSGVLWALAYERARSLLPALFAHAANNVMSTLWIVGLLR
jgi:membrane protease YdiL (CAAX protease family)